MTTIYESILARLTAQVPELKWIDLEKGQMNYERPTIVFPAALIGISLPKIENLNQKKQVCEAYVTIKLCFDFTGNTSVSTPEATRLASLAYFDLCDKIFNVLQGWGNGEMNPMSRINVAEELRPDAYKAVKIIFKTAFHEIVV